MFKDDPEQNKSHHLIRFGRGKLTLGNDMPVLGDGYELAFLTEYINHRDDKEGILPIWCGKIPSYSKSGLITKLPMESEVIYLGWCFEDFEERATIHPFDIKGGFYFIQIKPLEEIINIFKKHLEE